MTYPRDIDIEGKQIQPILPRVAFWLAQMTVAGIGGALHAEWWQLAIGALAVWLVRVTSRAEVI